jgi:hypothetical protein
MTTVYKVLGQSAPDAATETTVYTVPSANSAVTSTITICNRGTAGFVTMGAVPGGGSLADANLFMSNTAVAAYDTLALTLGLSLAAGTVIRANCSSGNFSISVFGSEIF